MKHISDKLKSANSKRRVCRKQSHQSTNDLFRVPFNLFFLFLSSFPNPSLRQNAKVSPTRSNFKKYSADQPNQAFILGPQKALNNPCSIIAYKMAVLHKLLITAVPQGLHQILHGISRTPHLLAFPHPHASPHGRRNPLMAPKPRINLKTMQKSGKNFFHVKNRIFCGKKGNLGTLRWK